MQADNSSDNLFEALRNLKFIDIVVAPDNCVVTPRLSNDWTLSRQLIDQHFHGIRRVGIVPRLGSARSNFAVIRFTDTAGRPKSALQRALSVAEFLETGFPKLDLEFPMNIGCSHDTGWHPIASYLERTSRVDEDEYQLWVFFDEPVCRKLTWMAFKSVLLAAEIEHNATILPSPAIQLTRTLDEAIWLPLYVGIDHVIDGKRFGSALNGFGCYLDRSTDATTELKVQKCPVQYASIDTTEALQVNLHNYFLSAMSSMPPRNTEHLSYESGQGQVAVLNPQISAEIYLDGDNEEPDIDEEDISRLFHPLNSEVAAGQVDKWFFESRLEHPDLIFDSFVSDFLCRWTPLSAIRVAQHIESFAKILGISEVIAVRGIRKAVRRADLTHFSWRDTLKIFEAIRMPKPIAFYLWSKFILKSLISRRAKSSTLCSEPDFEK